jgi:two-component system, NarL family, nitrate/nitrite response regulator NarL
VARGETSLRRIEPIRGQAGSATTGAGADDRSPHPVRVLLTADVRLYRELLGAALAGQDAIELAGSAPCDVAAIAVGMYEPGVVVVDAASVSVPDGLRALAIAFPEAKIVAVGIPDDDDSVLAVLEAGATGYITPEQPLPDLVAAIEAAAHGELQCPPRVSAALARRMAALAAAGPREATGDGLTAREHEIATLIAEGLSNKQIARRLSIEHATVKNHVHSILVKLGVSRREHVGTRLHAYPGSR